MSKEVFKMEDIEEEMNDFVKALLDLMERIALIYYTNGFIEGMNGCKTKTEESMIREKKTAGKAKVKKVMHEYKEKSLHSGSKKGPVVKSKKQAVAVALKSKVKPPKKAKK